MPTQEAVFVGAAVVAVVAPLVGAVGLQSRLVAASLRRLAVGSVLLSLAASGVIPAAWSAGAGAPLASGERLGGGSLLVVDGITAVLLPYVIVVELAILLVAPRRSLEPEAACRILYGAAATCALFLTAHPVALVVLWCVTALPTWWTVRDTPGGRPAARVYLVAMSVALVCMATGTALLVVDPPWSDAPGPLGTAGGWLVAVAIMIRKGIFPFHSWYPALFRGGPMSTALAATMPQVASYTAVRLLIGHADHPEGVAAELVVLSQLALVTATYGAALAIVQRDLRSLIGTLAMSQSALVLAGLAGTLPMELNGALCVWVSSGLALTGIGLVTWALESRAGVIRLDTPQGRFWDAPALAGFFLLFGLAGIGLPGTLSFVADDLIVSG
ncbi:MAG: proton-conducting transporter membrane subunit, partial [Planctomycetia bacterium]